MPTKSRIRYTPQERSSHLTSLYQYLLSKVTGEDMQSEGWKIKLADTLPSDDRNPADSFLPKTINAKLQDGTVDSLWCMFSDPNNQGWTLGVWYLNVHDAVVYCMPDPKGYQRTRWYEPGHPQMVVYLWSEPQIQRGRRSSTRQCDVSTWSRIVQVRQMQWVAEDRNTGGLPPRRVLKKRSCQGLAHGSVKHDFTGRAYETILADRRSRWYQGRLDERLNTLLDMISKYKEPEEVYMPR